MKKYNKGFTLMELLIVIVMLVILGSLLFGGIRGCSTYSEGSRVGTVTKLSLKGVSHKTWEGELLLGGMRNTTDADGASRLTGNVWEFTVDNNRKDLIETIQNAMDRNKTVRITYEEKAYHNAFEGDTRYRVKEVKVIEPDKR